MKTILNITLILFIGGTAYASNELDWVDEQIKAIKPSRKSVSITSVDTPFVFLNKNKPKDGKESKDPKSVSNITPTPKDTTDNKKSDNIEKKDAFLLSTIINSSALINGNWYKKNDKLGGYTIIDISKNSVTLKREGQELLLSTLSTNQNVKFKNK